MKHKLAHLIDRARKLETSLASTVEGAARSLAGSPERQPLEIVHAIVDEIGRDVEPSGRGQSVFPFNHVRVLLVAPSAKHRARLEVACEGPPSLQRRIEDRLESLGCAAATLVVKVAFVPQARAEWLHKEFQVECTRATATPAPAVAAPGALALLVTRGTTESASYQFATTLIAVGRGAEVRDSRDRLVRTNHVAFVEVDDEINRSVSRRHARIERDVTSGACRIFDDGSVQGTSVIREGRSHEVPRGAKGLRLRDGDEIVIGQARVRVSLTLGTSTS